MLNRLYLDYGMRIIGLEGAFAPLDLSWFHALSSGDKKSIAVRLIAQGEINRAELMGMVYDDVLVEGVEDRQQYEQNWADAAGGGAASFHLLTFCELYMQDEDFEEEWMSSLIECALEPICVTVGCILIGVFLLDGSGENRVGYVSTHHCSAFNAGNAQSQMEAQTDRPIPGNSGTYPE